MPRRPRHTLRRRQHPRRRHPRRPPTPRQALRHACDPITVQVHYFNTQVNAVNMDDYIRAYNTAMRQWKKQMHGAQAPKPECMSIDTDCLPVQIFDVMYFAKVLCKQSGISCPGRSDPLGAGLAAGAAAGMMAGGKDGGGAPNARNREPLPTQISGRTQRLSNAQAADLAAYNGYHPTGEILRGERVFTNGKQYIVQDSTTHTGGTWKIANSASAPNSKPSRTATTDALLTPIGG